jgi:large subunit ribosomal protein L15
MPNLNIPKIIVKRSKRVGRGYGSGKGSHTVGRGQKGQKTRRTIPILFEGYKNKKSLLRRLPMLRGKTKFKAYDKPVVVNLEDLNDIPAGTTIDIPTLVKYNIVDEREAKKYGVKILGQGELKKRLIFNLPTSQRASQKLEKRSKSTSKEESK